MRSILDTSIRASVFALILLVGVLVLHVTYAVQSTQTLVEQVGGEAHVAAVTIVRAATGVERNVQNIVKPEGLLDSRLQDTNVILRNIFFGEPVMTPWGPGRYPGVLHRLDTFNENAQLLTGIVGLTLIGDARNPGLVTSVESAIQSINQVADQTAKFEEQLNEAFPLWNSRYLAITGEAMRTLDSSRRMMDQIEKATPTFIQKYDALLGNVNGIAEDFHVVTNRYARPSIKSQLKSGVFDALRVCVIVCR